jgi:hypothetical protein
MTPVGHHRRFFSFCRISWWIPPHGLDLSASRKGILRYGGAIASLTRQGLAAIESVVDSL